MGGSAGVGGASGAGGEMGGGVKGLFYLRNARDLLGKLRHDMQRLEQDQVDAYAAFDFFVTARHLPEWLYPEDSAKKDEVFANSLLMRVCRSIADGSKHFEAKWSQNDSVVNTSLEGAFFDPRYWRSGFFQTGHLIVELDGEAAEKFGASVEAINLARHVL